MTEVIRVTCDTKHRIAPEKLTPLQGDLKWLEEKQYEKLKASLLRHGFVFPEYVWKSGKTNYVTDGHQRLLAIEKMRSEGIVLEGGKIPIVYVKAKDKKQAMELILAATSQYGRLDEDSVYKFVMEANLVWSDIRETVDFPLNMGKLDKGWFDDDWAPEEGKAEKPQEETRCPACGHLFASSGQVPEKAHS